MIYIRTSAIIVLISILSLFLNSSKIFGQGILIKDSDNYLGVDAGFVFAEDSHGFEGGLGVSLKGRFDFGFSFGKLYFDNDFIDRSLDASGFGPDITIHLLKSNSLSFAISAGYIMTSFSKIPRSNILTLSSTSKGAGIQLYYFKKSQKKFNIIPVADLSFISSKFKTEIVGSHPTYETDNRLTLGLGALFLLAIKQKKSVFLAPSISISVDGITYALSSGYIFSAKK